MHCEQFLPRLHECLDRRDDPRRDLLLVRHAEHCEPCRRCLELQASLCEMAAACDVPDEDHWPAVNHATELREPASTRYPSWQSVAAAVALLLAAAWYGRGGRSIDWPSPHGQAQLVGPSPARSDWQVPQAQLAQPESEAAAAVGANEDRAIGPADPSLVRDRKLVSGKIRSTAPSGAVTAAADPDMAWNEICHAIAVGVDGTRLVDRFSATLRPWGRKVERAWDVLRRSLPLMPESESAPPQARQVAPSEPTRTIA